jgi:hypothetical protein
MKKIIDRSHILDGIAIQLAGSNQNIVMRYTVGTGGAGAAPPESHVRMLCLFAVRGPNI